MLFGSGVAAADAVTVPGDYQDVQSAVDAAAADGSISEVVVTGGTYTGTLTLDAPGLTVRTSSPGAATVEGSDSETGAAVSIAADGVTVAGFEVRNSGKLLGVKVQAGYDGVVVSRNHVHDVGPFTRLGTTGIVAGGGNADLEISDNVVEDVSSEFSEESGYPTTNGIFLDDKQSSYTDATVSGNIVRDLTAETAPIGILFQGDQTALAVRGNRVTGLSASNDRTPEEQDGTEFVTYAQGINNTASSTQDATVERNVVDDVTAEFFNGEGLKVDGDASGFSVAFNDLLPTVGLANGTGTEVTATCNYWGHPKGPRRVDGNRVADDEPNPQGRSAVFGPADTSQWLVRSVTNGRNVENACVGGDGPGKGGPGNGGGPP